jgi:hypothetical protein
MTGSNNRTCVRGRWTGQKPHCYGLNQENDYASKFHFISLISLLHFKLNLEIILTKN